jgi:hypothetical protein
VKPNMKNYARGWEVPRRPAADESGDRLFDLARECVKTRNGDPREFRDALLAFREYCEWVGTPPAIVVALERHFNDGPRGVVALLDVLERLRRATP